MKNGANSPFITSGSSPPETCSAITSHDNSKIWMTSDEAALYLRCKIKTLYNYKCNGKLTGHNRGGTRKGQLLFDRSELDLFITGKGVKHGHSKK